MRPDWPTLLANRAELCRQIAPDLQKHGLALYVLQQSELPEGWRDITCALAWTSRRQDLYLRAHLGSRWRGRGGVVVVNDRALESALSPDLFEHQLTGIILHELAHVIQYLPSIRVPEEKVPLS